MSSNSEINERLWKNLPTAPIPNLEEMKVTADFNVFWQDFGFADAISKEAGEMIYRRGRQDGKAAATAEILGKR